MGDLRGYRYRDERGEGAQGPSRLIRELQTQARRLQEQAAALASVNDELAASEARLQGIVDSALDAIITTDSRDRVIGWNPPAERIFGWTAAEASGRDIGELILMEDERARHRKGLRKYLETGEWKMLGRRLEIEGVRRDGRVIPVELTVAATGSRHDVLFTTFIRDISERVREERIRDARGVVTRILAADGRSRETIPKILEGLGNALRCIGCAYWQPDSDGSRLTTAHVWVRGPPRDERRTEAEVERVGEPITSRAWDSSEIEWTHDADALDGDGGPRLCVIAVPVSVAGHRFGVIELVDAHTDAPRPDHLGMLEAVGSDIAQFLSRRQAEEQLEQRNEWHRFLARVATKLAAAGPDYEGTLRVLARLVVPRLADWCSVYTMEPGGEVRRVAMVHTDSEEADAVEGVAMEGMRLTRRHPARVVAETGEPILVSGGVGPILDETAGNEDELRRLRELNIVSGMIVPLNARGRSLGAILLLSLDPERVYRELELESAMELAARAAMFIDNARLYRDAQVANETKADFLATMSHELRTPLNAILGYADLLTQGIPEPIGPGVEKYVRRISFSAHHLLQLIEEILTYSRLEAGREHVALERLNMETVAEEVRAIMEPMAAEKSIDLEVDMAGIDRLVTTDARKVRQILLNLMSNAVKFTHEGGVEVRGTLDGDEFVLTVSDTGIGMSKDHLERIFEPFWQVEQTNTRTAHGTGLGLSVTRRFAHLLGGTIKAESQPGEGSAFEVRLPVEPAKHAGADIV